MSIVNLVGQKFNLLTVIEEPFKKEARTFCNCQCECKKRKTIRTDHLLSGQVKSCGCLVKKDLSGKTFTKLKVIEEAGTRNKERYWKCQCECGNISFVSTGNLNNGTVKSCGCTTKKDLTGRRFGHLLVNRYSHFKSPRRYWECECLVCRNNCYRSTSFLTSQTNSNSSCGCLVRENFITRNTKHGESSKRSREYKAWLSMMSRCYKASDNGYCNYGGRGITVCDRWRNSYENFLEDMGRCPEKFELDRIDVDGDYCPENCRWLSKKEQARNKRTTVFLEFNGQKKSLADWADEFEIPYRILWGRLKSGWEIKKALTTKVRKR